MNEQDELFMREALPRAGRDGQLEEEEEEGGDLDQRGDGQSLNFFGRHGLLR